MLHDAMEFQGHDVDQHADQHVDDDHEHDQVGTVEVQILLSWFFESSSPDEVAIDLPRAA